MKNKGKCIRYWYHTAKSRMWEIYKSGSVRGIKTSEGKLYYVYSTIF